MALLRVYPPCPHCGAQRAADGQPLAKKEMNGWANDGEVPIYYLKCLHCEEHFMVGMFALPIHASMSALDENLRKRLRDTKRTKYGYDVATKKKTRRQQRLSSDRIHAIITITKGSMNRALAKRLNYRFNKPVAERTVEYE